MTVYTKRSKKGPIYKSEGTISASPAVVFHLLNSVEGRIAWDSSLTCYDLVERLDSTTEIVRSVTKEQAKGIVSIFTKHRTILEK